MRILLVNAFHFPGGGDSTYTFNLASLLRSRGHDVDFFAMQSPRNIRDENDDLFVRNIDFQQLNNNRTLTGGMQVLRRVLYSPEARRKFAQLIDRVKPELVHLQNFAPQMSFSIVLEAKRRRLPIVWTLHDYGLVCPNSHFWIDSRNGICEACMKGNFLSPLLKRCKKGSFLASALLPVKTCLLLILGIREKVDCFLCPSIFLRTRLLKAGMQESKIHHLPLFLPDSQFSSTVSNEGYILFLGRLTVIKGIFPLLEACRRAPNIRLVVAGSLDPTIQNQLPAILPPNAHYVGLVQGERLHELLAGASAVIAPSLCFENQPFSILEAYASAKPVIASDLGGMRELVVHGERGLLVPPANAQALSEAMRWILAHPSEATRMGAAAQVYARTFHSASEHYRRLSSIYHQFPMSHIRPDMPATPTN